LDFCSKPLFTPRSCLAMAAIAPPRRVLVAVSPDASDAARTLRWAAATAVRTGDRVSLVHVARPPEALAAAATPLLEVALPAASLPTHIWGRDASSGTAADVIEALKALQAAAASVDAAELRSVLRPSDALLSYVRFLPAEEKADVLVMGSHGARYVGSAIWKVPHASLDVAAGNTACAMFFLRGDASAVGDASAGRFVAIALDGAAPASTLLARWAIVNALRPNDTAVIVNQNVAADPR